jgi:tRNA threonylcarbamoyladenosine biosynthesis protein TsaB
MIQLLMDTATERAFIAIVNVEMDQVLAHIELDYGYHHSHSLFPALLEALRTAKLELDDVELITVGTGPGSYTGIRVAAALGKVLSFSKKIPLVGVPSLVGFLADAKQAAIVDARSGGAYLLFAEEDKPVICSNDSLEEALKNTEILCTPNASKLKKKIHGDFQWLEKAPDFRRMAKAGMRRYQEGSFTLNGGLKLLYLREAVCI